MANVITPTTAFVDTTGDLDIRTNRNIKVSYIVMTSTGASALAALQDISGPTDKMELRIDTTDKSQIFDFSRNPLIFANGVRIGTLTNAKLTLVYSGT